MLSTVPPTSCGIATFATALACGLEHHGAEVLYVDVGESMAAGSKATVALGTASPTDIAAVANELNTCSATIVQHEYGIYPGDDGCGVLDIVEQLTNEVIIVAHTVLSTPTANQYHVLTELCSLADIVVVMTEVARQRLIHHYDIDVRRITVIPHGAAVPTASSTPVTDSPRILTWGLLGPGKGIEWAIDAMGELPAAASHAHYLVAGATHPNVKARDGEAYRDSLKERARRRGVGDRVIFDDAYRSVSDLCDLIATAHLVVLPYDSVDQVTSGVLVDAVAAGRPVVSTAFPHAEELLATGAGIVVPQSDSSALAAALATVLTDTTKAHEMRREACRLAPSLSWPSVAARYLDSIRLAQRNLTTVA